MPAMSFRASARRCTAGAGERSGPPDLRLGMSRQAPGRLRSFDRRVEAAFDDVEAPVPEAGIGEVDADHRAELLGRLRSARAQQVEVARDEATPLLLVPR